MTKSILKARLGLGIVTLCALSFSGCMAINQHMTGMLDTLSIHAKQQHDLASIRSDTREKLAEEREAARRAEAQNQIEQARLDAEQLRLEREFCIANQKLQQQQLKSNVKQSVESRIAFNAEHALEVGELEVDTEALKTLLDKRDKETPPTQPLVQPPKKPCSCCDQPCGCRPGLLRRLCPKCSRKPCEAEKNCGGPAALAQLQQQPLKQPLRPAEIPMKLPVRLTFGLQQPQLEGAKITVKPPTQPLTDNPNCPRCDMPGNRCACTDSCVDRDKSATKGGVFTDKLDPPQPLVDDSAANETPTRARKTTLASSTSSTAKKKTSSTKSSNSVLAKPAGRANKVVDQD